MQAACLNYIYVYNLNHTIFFFVPIHFAHLYSSNKFKL